MVFKVLSTLKIQPVRGFSPTLGVGARPLLAIGGKITRLGKNSRIRVYLNGKGVGKWGGRGCCVWQWQKVPDIWWQALMRLSCFRVQRAEYQKNLMEL